MSNFNPPEVVGRACQIQVGKYGGFNFRAFRKEVKFANLRISRILLL